MIHRLLPVILFKTTFSNEVRLFSTKMSKKTALVLLSEGTEEMEFVISVDVLRRAGMDVTVGGLQGDGVHVCSRQVKITPDMALSKALESGPYDVVVLPGGLGGAKAFSGCSQVAALLKEQETSGRLLAAICAAPTALKSHGVALGKTLTCYPSLEEELMEGNLYKYSQDKVVIDGNVITSRGPGTAFEFSLAIVKELLGAEAANTVAKPMLL